MRYGYDLGCRFSGYPHDLIFIYENNQYKFELCKICSKKFKWAKSYKGRIQNAEYVKAHVRNFAQSWGATKRIYNTVYKSELSIIKI